jgi:phage tail-like protein
VFEEDMTLTIDLDVAVTFEAEISTPETCWDLKEMMPAKFRQAPMVVGYLDALSTVVNAIAGRINKMTSLADVDTCPRKYIGHLASLIAFKLQNQKYATIQELRNQIKMAIEMYKIKGTYTVLKLAFYMIGLDVKIWDLWTRDYVVFDRHAPHKHTGIPPAYGGWETVEQLHMDDGYHFDETDDMGNPSPWRSDGGLGFKSPHYDLVIAMNKLLTYEGYLQSLFVMEYWDYIAGIVEEYTPINTVPRLFLELYGMCYENYESYLIVDSQVRTCIMDGWTQTALIMDDGNLLDEHLEAPFPDQKFLDQSFEAMLETITILKLGTGNIGNTPDRTDTDLETIVYTGTITRFSMTQDVISFYAQVPVGTELEAITEIGLYQDILPTERLAIETFCPQFDKPSAATLEIRIDVTRKQI